MQKRIFKVGFAALVVALLGLAVCFFPAEAQELVLYDNFDGVKYLDPDLWHGSTGAFGGGLDVVREIERSNSKKDKDNGKLRMGATAYSWEGGGYEFGTRFNNFDGGGSQNITAMEAEVKITDCEFTICPDNDYIYADPRFEMMGSFFSTGLGVTGEECWDNFDDLDEVHAAIMLCPTRAGGGNIFHVWARIFRAPWDPIREYWYDLGTDLGWIVEKGDTVTVGLRWDPDNHSFIFQLDEETHEISYWWWLNGELGGTDTDPPCGGFKTIRPLIGLPDGCPGVMSMGSLEFLTDNVRIENAPPW